MPSPYAAMSPGASDGDTYEVPQAVHNQLRWMNESQELITKEDVNDEVLDCLQQLGTVGALDALKFFEQHGGSVGEQQQRLVDHVSTLSTWLVGTWQGLESGRDFGWIKKIGGGRAQRVWCHRRSVDHIDKLVAEDMVQFRLSLDSRGKTFAVDVSRMCDGVERTHGDTLLWSTQGGLDPQRDRVIPPRLLLLTADEVAVLRKYNMETQHARDDVADRSCFIEKIVRIPRIVAEWPLEEDLLTHPTFQEEDAQRALLSLNAVKSELKCIDIQIWKEHTRKTVLTAHVVPELRRVADAEMCTNAFAKMSELLNAFPLVAEPAATDPVFRSLHLCEGPGAFVCAVNHHIRQRHRRVRWDWRASTLNPHHEANGTGAMIEEDAFINETAQRWLFGADNSGDLTARANIESTWAAVRTWGHVMLVTADGSIDCSSDPAAQERLVAPLHLCEVVCALGALHRGGALVLKMFTLLEASSLGLLWLLARAFEEVHVTKPAMSTAGNSETYVVCLRFCGVEPRVLAALLRRTGPQWPRSEREEGSAGGAAVLPRAQMGDAWVEEVVTCARFFAEMQAAVIARNVRLFRGMAPADRAAIATGRRRAAAEWMRRVGVERIAEEERVVARRRLTGGGGGGGAGGKRERRRGRGDLERRRAEEAKRRRMRWRSEEGPAAEAEAGEREYSEGGEGDEGEEEGGETGARGAKEAGVDWLAGGGRGGGARRSVLEGESEMGGWLLRGPVPREFTQSKACGEELLLEVLHARGELRRAIREGSVGDDRLPGRVRACGEGGVEDAGGGGGAGSGGAERVEEVWAQSEEGDGGRGLVGEAEAEVVWADLHGSASCSAAVLRRLGGRARAGWVLHRGDKGHPEARGLRGVAGDAEGGGRCAVAALRGGGACGADVPEDYRAVLGEAMRGAEGACALVFADAVGHETEGEARAGCGGEEGARSREPGSTGVAVCQGWAALRLLRPGGALLCRVEDTVGRGSLGLLHLWSACFERVGIAKPAAAPAADRERWVVCRGFAGLGDAAAAAVIGHLEAAMEALAQGGGSAAEGRWGVLELVPMRVLVEGAMVEQVRRSNERCLRAELRALRRLLRSPARADSARG